MFNYEFPPVGGGTGVACQQLLQVFGRIPELRVDLVTSGVGRQRTVEELEPNVEVHRLPIGKRDLHFWRGLEVARWTWSAYRLARQLISERRYDLSHCWAGWPSGVLGYRLRQDLPYLVALRGSDVPGYSPRLSLLDPLLFRNLSRRVWGEAAAVVAVSEELRRLAVETGPELDIRVIPNAADTEMFVPGFVDGGFMVLFVGRLISRKGVASLLEAFTQVLESVPDSQLVVVGEGPEGLRLRTDARERGLENAVTFKGHVARDNLPQIYQMANVFVLPSVREGMPNVLLEAMASGLPVVTTEHAAELLDGNGMVVAPGDARGLANALVQYAHDPGLRSAHGRRSRELAESLTWDEVASWYLDLYRELVNPTKGQAG